MSKGRSRKPFSLLSACWGASEIKDLEHLCSSGDFAQTEIRRLRDKACQAPPPMSDALLNALDDQPLLNQKTAMPKWAQYFCNRREHFEGVVFVITRLEKVEYWFFNFASLMPVYLSFAKLTVQETFFTARS